MIDTLGVGAALISPLAMTIGFYVWGEHWNGSAFSLNLFKCTLASSLFILTAMAIDSAGFLQVSESKICLDLEEAISLRGWGVLGH